MSNTSLKGQILNEDDIKEELIKSKIEEKIEKVTKRKHENRGTYSTRRIIFGFLVVIIIGTLLLSLPIATTDKSCDIMTALFTATTSVCVTGLVVVDTFAHWTLFGKIVILCLIQLGGLGVVVFTSSLLLVFGKKVTLKKRVTIQDAFNLNNMQGMVVFIKRVIKGTLIIEGLGMIIYMIAFIPRYGFLRGIWYSLFNSVSAFCNAGMDIIGPDSLITFNNSPLVLINTSFLIIMGGLGFVVWFDALNIFDKIRKKELLLRDFFAKITFHSKVVLSMTFCLILIAWILILAFEFNNPATLGNMSLGDKLLNSYFQSVTLRTAGFASINQKGLTDSTVIISIIWMFIGGSPAGTAGGIKTVTSAVIFFTIISVIFGRKETVMFKKTINAWLIRRVLAVTFIAVFGFVVMSVLILCTNDVSLVDTVFETASAIGTVGLSRGITSYLNTFGKIIIIIGMYLGRIGPISLLVAFNNNYTIKNSIHYAEADIIVG